MATFADELKQSTNEIHTYTVDFTHDLPAGGTVVGGTATHIPPSGTISALAVNVTSPFVYVTVPVQSVVGVHYIDVVATFNDGDKSEVRIPVTVVYSSSAARAGMADLVAELRGMTEAGPSDYIVAGQTYWTDAQLQRVLDAHRTDLKFVEMTAWEEGDGSYLEYEIGYGNLEIGTGGTAVFFVQDVNGAYVDESLYSVDHARGMVAFGTDTEGATYYASGRSYDLNAAAAEVWRRKMTQYHMAYNFSTDNNSMSREALFQHAKEMAVFYEGQGSESMQTMSLYRSDTDGWDPE